MHRLRVEDVSIKRQILNAEIFDSWVFMCSMNINIY